MFSNLGFKPLESEQLMLPPVPGLAEATRSWDGSYTLSPDALRNELTGDERTVHRDLSSSPVAHHVLLTRRKRKCYLVATLGRRKRARVPYAEIQYIGDPEFFWDNLMLAHAALFRAMGVAGLAIGVDSRFLGERKPPPLALRLPARRLYRPAREEITPIMIDGLYSELMGLRF